METGEMGLGIHGVLFAILFLMHAWAFREKSLKFFGPDGWPKDIGVHFSLLAAGILLWGIYPIWYHGPESTFNLMFGTESIHWAWVSGVLALSLLAFFIGRRQAHLVSFAEDHFLEKPTIPLILAYFLVRIVFLIAYEIWFRGWFLGELLVNFDQTWVAIAMNTALYSLIHIFAGKKEAISSVPFGVILCLLTMGLQVVWPAAVIHLFLSMGYELNFILRLNNDTISK